MKYILVLLMSTVMLFAGNFTLESDDLKGQLTKEGTGV